MNSRSQNIRCAKAGRRVAELFLLMLVFAGAGAVSARAASPSDEGGTVHWVQVDEGQVKLDGKPPIGSGLYLPDKKSKAKGSELVLVLLGRRYLMVDLKSRLVYEVPLSDVHHQGSDIESGDLSQQSHLIPSSDWTIRDVGPAELVQLSLGDYGRVLEIQLPHPRDLRGLYVIH
jgi:hypothetical protein